ncbi:MAG: hypothetical protein IPP87_14345 [Ideonella sp.]|nr:hypothetical protein [Ideonella sp.]
MITNLAEPNIQAEAASWRQMFASTRIENLAAMRKDPLPKSDDRPTGSSARMGSDG